ncbi:MAG TPA: VanZ family protein [Burkholderiaceae bacterium]|jgi:VanZ family protein|nr:VanZ family protein [Burkholderiaceae bacterium]
MDKATRAPARIPRLPADAPAHPRESSALTLALVFTGLVIYASLYPFSGWFWPAGQPLSALLVPPWPRYHLGFDDWSNFVGYMPLGALVYASALRRGRRPLAAGAIACVLPSLLSWTMEFTQHFLPGRYPSLMDWTLNSLGAAAGASLGVAVQAAGAGVRWSTLRERWFVPRSGATLALLTLWPVGFLYPRNVPFCQGVTWERLQEAAYDLLSDHPLAPWFDWLWASLGTNTGTMSMAAEAFAVALGLLGPCLLAFAVSRPGWRRAALVVAAVAVGLAANTLSAALNFGPVHALGWVTATVPIGLTLGTVLALACVPIGQRAAAALGLVALSVDVALVAQAPSDPYYAQSLQQWEQGRFIHFHGLAQWVGWLWPFAALAGLFRRVVRNDAPAPA